MAIKDFLNKVSSTMAGAGETIKNYSAARQSNKQAKANITTLAKKKALQGTGWTENDMVSEQKGGLLSSKYKGIEENRKKIEKETKQKYGI